MKDEYIRDNKESIGSLGHIGADQRSLWPKQGQVDGRGDELADRRAEGRHRIRVLKSIQAYMGKRKRK